MNVSGLESWKLNDLYEAIIHGIYKRLINNGVFVQLDELYLVGSRVSGTHKQDSDLDVVFLYEDDYGEDRLLDIINKEPIVINRIRVDVIPRREFVPVKPYIKLI